MIIMWAMYPSFSSVWFHPCVKLTKVCFHQWFESYTRFWLFSAARSLKFSHILLQKWHFSYLFLTIFHPLSNSPCLANLATNQERRNDFKSGAAKRGGLGVAPPAGIEGAEPLGGGQGAKPPEGSAFSKMRLEFVHQVDGTIITKLLTKKFFFFPFFKLKSGTANAVPAVAVPTTLMVPNHANLLWISTPMPPPPILLHFVLNDPFFQVVYSEWLPFFKTHTEWSPYFWGCFKPSFSLAFINMMDLVFYTA